MSVNHNVIPIRPGLRIRRQQPADQQTAQWAAAMLSKAERADNGSSAASDIASLAMTLAAKDRIPAFNLRCIHGTLDIRSDYRLRLAEKREAKARADALQAERDTWNARNAKPGEWIGLTDEQLADVQRLWAIYQRATLDYARTPSPTKAELAQKRREIGRVWLNARGDWYQQLRDALAEDEQRLAVASAGRRARA